MTPKLPESGIAPNRPDESQEAELDEALEETFPASDPIAVENPEEHGQRMSPRAGETLLLADPVPIA